jgi:hypothetical protein
LSAEPIANERNRIGGVVQRGQGANVDRLAVGVVLEEHGVQQRRHVRALLPCSGHTDWKWVPVDHEVAGLLATEKTRHEIEESRGSQVEPAGAQRGHANLSRALEAEEHREREDLIDVAFERRVEDDAERRLPGL